MDNLITFIVSNTLALAQLLRELNLAPEFSQLTFKYDQNYQNQTAQYFLAGLRWYTNYGYAISLLAFLVLWLLPIIAIARIVTWCSTRRPQ